MSEEPGKTIAQAMAWGRATLTGVSENAARDASLLLAYVLKSSPEYPYLHPDAFLDKSSGQEYRDLVGRRARGEPIAYIRGFQEFMGLCFAVDRRVLIPRPETEILVEEVLRFLDSCKESEGPSGPRALTPARPSATDGRCVHPVVADIGCGSGAIGLSVAKKCPFARVILTDVSEDALEVARQNAMSLDLQGGDYVETGLALRRVAFLRGDLLEPLRARGIRALDVIASNPPYIASHEMDGLPAEVRSEPRLALSGGPDGLYHIRRLILEAGSLVRPGGMLIMEIDHKQAADVLGLLKGSGWEDPKILPDLAGLSRVALGYKSPEPHVTPIARGRCVHGDKDR
jgi:release factor glutamine methyltransferase